MGNTWGYWAHHWQKNSGYLIYDGPELIKEIDWSNINGSFLNAVFPSVEGHDKNIYEYLKDE